MFTAAVVLSILCEILTLCYLPQIYAMKIRSHEVGWKKFLADPWPKDYPAITIGILSSIYMIFSVCLLFSPNIYHVWTGTIIIAFSVIVVAIRPTNKLLYYIFVPVSSIICIVLLILLLT